MWFSIDFVVCGGDCWLAVMLSLGCCLLVGGFVYGFCCGVGFGYFGLLLIDVCLFLYVGLGLNLVSVKLRFGAWVLVGCVVDCDLLACECVLG